ncbi:MAG TPA: hypothetical protein VNV42_00990 [Solirubrobacteraceae bacterium]|jgi:hypothetical protein|nr:hypothetical protein [Solirubrobacteraceae bacterium]
MGLRRQTNNIPDLTGAAATAARQSDAAAGVEETAWSPAAGAYLTDGTALFCVAEAISNRGELLLELENCVTYELILCPARTVVRLGLRSVTPAPVA